MITILTTPKPSTSKAKLDFVNALRNWRALTPTPQVLVFGGEEDLITRNGGVYVEGVRATDRGLPYMDAVFATGRKMAEFDTMMLTSDHLMFMPGLMEAVARVEEKFDTFLAVGQRHDIDISKFINYDNRDWSEELFEYVADGRLHGPSAKDYMILSKNFPLKIPPFILGRPWYDTWLVVAALNAGIPVVDLSRTVIAAHPNHDYSQIPGNPLANHGNPGELFNAQLASDCAGKGHVTTSTWIDTKKGIRERAPQEDNASVTAPVRDVSQNYKEPSIADKQREIADRQLSAMHAGNPPPHFDSYGQILKRLRGMTDSPRFSMVDAGCGSAYYHEISEYYVPGWILYTGLDYNKGMLAMAKDRYPNITLREADLRDMNLPPKSYDIVLSGAAIMHIQEWEKAVVELANAAKRFLILHRTWVHTDNTPTSGRFKTTYDVEAWFGTINEKELIMLVGSLGLNLIEHCQAGEGDQVKTYVFEREKI